MVLRRYTTFFMNPPPPSIRSCQHVEQMYEIMWKYKDYSVACQACRAAIKEPKSTVDIEVAVASIIHNNSNV